MQNLSSITRLLIYLLKQRPDILDFQVTITKPNSIEEMPYGFLINRTKAVYPNENCPDFIPDNEPTDKDIERAKEWRFNHLNKSWSLDSATKEDKH